jgi:hypothetical protein
MKRSLRDVVPNPKTPRSHLHRPLRPIWLHINIPKRHGKGKEMVYLSKDSLLSSIPAELQLHIIQNLGYRDAISLKATCRYYNYFISGAVIEDSKTRQLQDFEEIERHSKVEKPANVPCYTCLEEKPIAQFYNIPGRWYYNTQPCLPLPDPGTRCCIPCAFKTKRVEPGLNLSVNGTVHLICSGCKKFEKSPTIAAIKGNNHGKYCVACKTDFEELLAYGWKVRFFQFVLGIIIFAVACTGQSVPTSSVMSKQLLRFILTIILVSCGTSACNNLNI